MRLHRLTVTAIGPFAGSEDIDFDALTAGGLFLLEGPTGAGKSTILDAITFALYGGLAGTEADLGRLHSHFADPASEPGVALELSVSGTRYRITRVPPHERAKKRGVGTTTDGGRAHLERLDGAAWTSLATDRREIGDEIARLVGLTRAQFTQVVLLPQNEFASFLRSDDEARRKLLTKLFGTHLYDAITQNLEAARTDATRRRRDADTAVATTLAAALEAAGTGPQARDDALALDAAARRALLDALRDRVAAAEQAAAAVLADADQRLAAAHAAQTEAAMVMARVEARRVLVARRDAHQLRNAAAEERLARIASARRAEPVRALVARVSAAAERAQRCELDLEVARRALPDELRTVDDVDALRTTAREAGETAASLTELAVRETGLGAARTAVALLDAGLGEARTRLARATAELATLPALEEQHRAALDELRRDAAGADAAIRAHAELIDRLHHARRATELRSELGRAADARREAVARARSADTDVQHLQDARVAGMSGELAASLTDEAPCPVCGSFEHPAPARRSEDAVTEASLDEARGAREAAEQHRAAAEKAEAALRDELARAEVRSQGASVDELVLLVEPAAGSVARATAAAESLDAAVAAFEVVQQTHRDLGTERVELGEHVTRLETERDHAVRGADELAVAVETHRDGYPTIGDRSAALVALRDACTAASDALALAQDAAVTLRAAEVDAHAEATARGFTDLAAATAAVLNPDALDALVSDADAHERLGAELHGALDAPELVAVSGLDPSAARAAAAAAAEVEAAARLVRETAVDAHATARDHAQRFTARLDEVDRAVAAHEHVTADTAAVYRMTRMAKGDLGQRPMELTAYVLRRRFDEIVDAANLRLATMSDGRYELARTDGAGRRGGLTLEIVDAWSGETRSPASLSGGETFFTSLALALGLADVVKSEAGGVELDTLFIDEGFGSLDTETLEKVMEVIDGLRDRGRAVGIVSHVADLRERVHERLEISRRADGSSSTRVVA